MSAFRKQSQKLLKVAVILLLKMWFLPGVPTGTMLYSYFNYNISFITIKDLILLKHSVCENKNKAVWYNEIFFFFFSKLKIYSKEAWNEIIILSVHDFTFVCVCVHSVFGVMQSMSSIYCQK